MEIAWFQVLVAFFLGVFLSATAKGLISSVKSKATGG
jgi:hypothetical protein